MSENISNANQPAPAQSYSGAWVKAGQELPEDGEPVLVLTDEYCLGLGHVIDGKWQLVLAPWAFHREEDSEVIYWTTYPETPWD
jgi:hypothetical protein